MKYFNIAIPRALRNGLLTLSLALALTLQAQQVPGEVQTGPIRLTGGTIHVGNGTVIEQGILDFDQGRITYAGPASQAPDSGQYEIIDVSGKHVYPGLIAPCNTLGLVEVGQVRASVDQDEIGDFIPHVRSLVAYNAESKVVESMRPNGVLLAQTTPVGGIMSGTSSIVQLDAWNWQDAAVKADDGIHMNWPDYFRRGRSWLGEAPGRYPNKEYGETIEKIEEFLATSKAYHSAGKPDLQLDHQAMKGAFTGKKRVYLYADGAREIEDGITLLKKYGIEKIVLVGGYEAPRVSSFLKNNDIPVLVSQTHSLPGMDDNDYDYTYKLPRILNDLGLRVGIQNSSMSNWETRNLPFFAGQLLSQGVDEETALSMVSYNTAEILGIGSNYGSLETGKSATLFVSEGSALEVMGNKLTHAFIDGRRISLETHQTRLWKRYMAKYGSPVED